MNVPHPQQEQAVGSAPLHFGRKEKGRHRKVKENETWGWIYDTIKLFMKVSVCRRSGADAASIDRNRDRIRMASLILFLFLVQVM